MIILFIFLVIHLASPNGDEQCQDESCRELIDSQSGESEGSFDGGTYKIEYDITEYLGIRQDVELVHVPDQGLCTHYLPNDPVIPIEYNGHLESFSQLHENFEVGFSMKLDSLGPSNQEFFSISSGHLLRECNGKYMGLYLSTEDDLTTLSIGKCEKSINVASPGVTPGLTPRSSKTLKSPNEKTPKSPKTKTPKENTPKTATPMSPKTPKTAKPKEKSPKTPKETTPTPKTAIPKEKTPKDETPKSPKTAIPKEKTPKSPKTASPKEKTPKSPKTATPKDSKSPKTPKTATPKEKSPKTATSKEKSPKTTSPKDSSSPKSAKSGKSSKSPKASSSRSSSGSGRRRRDSEEYEYEWRIFELGTVVDINLNTWDNHITVRQSETFIQIDINGHVHFFPNIAKSMHLVDLWVVDVLFDEAIEISEPADGHISDLTVSSGNSMDKCNGKF